MTTELFKLSCVVVANNTISEIRNQKEKEKAKGMDLKKKG